MGARVGNDWARRWAPAVLHAGVVALAMLGLTGYWFGVADRYAVFLYGHLGATPFDPQTRSRYWMTGLVAAGMVLVGYTAVNWSLGRWAALRGGRYLPPPWPHVWVLAALPVAGGIVATTTTVNAPTLPLSDALRSALTALAGLALALPFGEWAAVRPGKMVWGLAHGLGMVPVLGLLYAPERAGLGWVTSREAAWAVALAGLVASAVWLGLWSVLRWWRGVAGPWAIEALWIGCAWTYLLGPLAHYVLETPPGYRYITVAANFFANRVVVQLGVWAVAAVLAFGAAWLRRALPSRPHPGRGRMGEMAGRS